MCAYIYIYIHMCIYIYNVQKLSQPLLSPAPVAPRSMSNSLVTWKLAQANKCHRSFVLGFQHVSTNKNGDPMGCGADAHWGSHGVPVQSHAARFFSHFHRWSWVFFSAGHGGTPLSLVGFFHGKSHYTG